MAHARVGQGLAARLGVGLCEFGKLTVRCPKELAHILQRAGAVWEPGSRRWLVQRRRIGPVIRSLERATDPLFRHAGIDLDGDG
jgi:hypothetical protein